MFTSERAVCDITGLLSASEAALVPRTAGEAGPVPCTSYTVVTQYLRSLSGTEHSVTVYRERVRRPVSESVVI
jgi:hypothetical protein